MLRIGSRLRKEGNVESRRRESEENNSGRTVVFVSPSSSRVLLFLTISISLTMCSFRTASYARRYPLSPAAVIGTPSCNRVVVILLSKVWSSEDLNASSKRAIAISQLSSWSSTIRWTSSQSPLIQAPSTRNPAKALSHRGFRTSIPWI